MVGDLPPQMAILEIPTLRAHIKLTRCWQIYPPQMAILEIPTLRAHIRQTKGWQIYPAKMAILEIFTLRDSYLADQVLANLSP